MVLYHYYLSRCRGFQILLCPGILSFFFRLAIVINPTDCHDSLSVERLTKRLNVGQLAAVVIHRKAGRWRQIKNLVQTQLSQTVSSHELFRT